MEVKPGNKYYPVFLLKFWRILSTPLYLCHNG